MRIGGRKWELVEEPAFTKENKAPHSVRVAEGLRVVSRPPLRAPGETPGFRGPSYIMIVFFGQIFYMFLL